MDKVWLILLRCRGGTKNLYRTAGCRRACVVPIWMKNVDVGFCRPIGSGVAGGNRVHSGCGTILTSSALYVDLQLYEIQSKHGPSHILF